MFTQVILQKAVGLTDVVAGMPDHPDVNPG